MAIKIIDNNPYKGCFRGTEINYFAVKVSFSENEFKLMEHFEEELDMKMTDQIEYVLNGLFPKTREDYCSFMKDGVKKKYEQIRKDATKNEAFTIEKISKVQRG
tara:strand:+ start:1091 stop:1402 length:312 start_codon:yes stop_codon:yes gene_type:complete